MTDETAKAIVDCFVSHDGPTSYSNNICDALFAVASALRSLGTADAADPRGALELVAMELRDGLRHIGDNIGDTANAFINQTDITNERLDSMAGAIEGLSSELHGIGQEIGS